MKDFLKEQEKLNLIIKLLSKDATNYCDFGNKFIDDYISLLKIALGDKSDWYSWFVFENEFGKNELEVLVDGIHYKICNEKQFFDLCIKTKSTVLRSK